MLLRWLTSTLFLSLCLAFASSAVAAPDPPRRHMLRFDGAFSFTAGAPEQAYGAGFGLDYEFRPIPYLGVVARWSALFFPGEQHHDVEAGAYHAVGVTLRARPLPRLALGGLWFSFGGNAVLSGDLVRGGIEAGAGFDFALVSFLRLGPFLRYAYVFPEGDRVRRGWGLVEIGVAIVGLLGAERRPPADRDYDGFPDAVDRCPDEPEDVDRFRDGDGCPEDDNDRDGILDWDDACPIEAEDIDGDRDEDGCPENPRDRDGDGLVDQLDECPDVAEDLDLFEDEDGCPDLDDDGDEILDVDDECPREPEVYNRFLDRDGCPDVLPPALAELRAIGGRILFERDEWRPTAATVGVLEEVAELIAAHPEWVVVRVLGHASDRGEPDHNLSLSQRRAEHVRDELIRRGISEDRLRVHAFGETQPALEGDSDEVRASNRRVVFDVASIALRRRGTDVQ